MAKDVYRLNRILANRNGNGQLIQPVDGMMAQQSPIVLNNSTANTAYGLNNPGYNIGLNYSGLSNDLTNSINNTIPQTQQGINAQEFYGVTGQNAIVDPTIQNPTTVTPQTGPGSVAASDALGKVGRLTIQAWQM